MNPFTIDLQMLGCLCQPGDDQDKCVRAYVIVAEYRLRGMYEGIPLYVSKCYRGRDAAERVPGGRPGRGGDHPRA